MKTFEQLRTEYMEKNSVPAYHPEVFLAKKWTKSELLRELKEAGFEISERTLNYYINIGLVDKPFIGSKRRGKGKESYFAKADFEVIRVVKTMQNRGHSLEEIKKGVVFTRSTLAMAYEPEADHGKIYFTKLATLLAHSVEPPYTPENFREYLGLLPPPGKHINTLEYHLVIGFIEADGALAELNKAESGFDNSTFISVFQLIWERSLEALYYKLLKPNDQRIKLEIATLVTADYRVEVMLSYIESLTHAIQAWVQSSPNKELANLPKIKLLLRRLS